MLETGSAPVPQEVLFALDIGTRSVIGIVGTRKNGLFEVLATERAEHDKRAMFDGQIEDIDQVAQISGLIKERLQERLGITLDNVCVAAAGRALQTCQATFSLELSPEEPITSQAIYQLEMGAIGLAQDKVNSSEEAQGSSLFCVGHSVIRYTLDDYQMTTLLGHKGKLAQVEVIATFLPNQVVDSLRSAMALIGLNIITLTLEPIAAMNAVIPTDLRLLNLALVDIGAGTSDIAVSRAGSVVAYTMATTAGDEITEYLMKRYLIDFATAERLKAEAGDGTDPVYYTDILGFEYVLDNTELLEALETPVGALAKEICDRILECNSGPPVAVFLVGGGSKSPLLPAAVARELAIDPKKVAIGGSGYMKKQTSGAFDLSDPEYATPLGIAITAASYAEQHSMNVFVNDQKVYMMHSSGYTVMNALLMCGYKYGQLMGKSGRSVTFTLNGENMMARGGLPGPAEITVNDKPGGIATGLASGDRVIIMPSVSGMDAAPRAGDFTKTPREQTVTVDGIPHAVGELAIVNGNWVGRDYLLQTDDVMTTRWLNSLGQLVEYLDMITEDRHFTINGQPAKLTDLLTDGDQVLSEDDQYQFQPAEHHPVVPEPLPEVVPVFDAWQEPELETLPEPLPEPEAFHGPTLNITLNQRQMELHPKEDKSPYQFIDMLNLVDIDPTKPEGDIVLKVNNQNASYLQEIHPGDAIQIYWSQR